MDAGDLLVESMGARERPVDQSVALFAGGWPAFIGADRTAAVHLPRIRRLFADWEIALLDPATDRLAAAGWGVPLQWDGDAVTLPSGYSAGLGRALVDHDRAAAADTLVICAVQVRPDLVRCGVAARVLAALIDAAQAGGMTRVIAPLRPTAKHLHPQTPIGRYARWTRPDGQAYDGWLRTHLAMGGRVIATAPASQVFTAPVGSWREWTCLDLPTSGRYLIPDALAPLEVDIDSGIGVLTEPGIWVQHR